MSILAEYMEAGGMDMELFSSIAGDTGLDDSYY